MIKQIRYNYKKIRVNNSEAITKNVSKNNQKKCIYINLIYIKEFFFNILVMLNKTDCDDYYDPFKYDNSTVSSIL